MAVAVGHIACRIASAECELVGKYKQVTGPFVIVLLALDIVENLNCCLGWIKLVAKLKPNWKHP